VAIHPKSTALMENSTPMAGKAILTEELMKGMIKELRMDTIRAQLLTSGRRQTSMGAK